MNYFDMNNLLLSQKLACGSSFHSNDTDSLTSNDIRDRALSNSSVSSQDCLPSHPYYQQNSIKDLNLLLALFTQNQQTTPFSQPPTSTLIINEKPRSNSDASSSAEEIKGLIDFSGFSLFSQNQFDRKAGGQVFIPKPIRQIQKQNSLFSMGNNCTTQGTASPSSQQSSSVQNLLLEASLNIFQNLLRKETTTSELEQQNMQTNSPSVCNTNSAIPQQSQIMYQPNIIFGVQLTPEDMQKRREHRRAKIEKYLFKKQTRKWDVLRYEVRKKIAKTRQRVKGRFVKEEIKPNSDDSFVSNPQIKSPDSTQVAHSDEQMNSADNI